MFGVRFSDGCLREKLWPAVGRPQWQGVRRAWGLAGARQQLTAADVIAFYFSAHWCPPCRSFTPLLKKFYETLHAHGERSLKIIFVSSDQSEHDMWKYVYDSHGDWLALKFSSELKDRLSRQFQVSGIPQLIVIDGVGRQAVRDARAEVMAATSSTQVLTTYLGWKSSAGASSAPQEVSSGLLAPGSRVKIRGLQSKPENNGLEGVVQSFDNSQRRYVVNIADRPLSLKPSNLLQIVQLRVRGPEPEDPWQEAELKDLDEASGEFLCALPDREVRLRLGPRVHVNAGAVVAVHGLQNESAKQWNEQNGKVSDFDEATQRYSILMSGGTCLKIKVDNLRLCPLT
ncbi:unnamed protein product [Effrenium voratum]|nr:unnamed protein product [Effrenium voratum]